MVSQTNFFQEKFPESKIGHFFCPFLRIPNTFGKRKICKVRLNSQISDSLGKIIEWFYKQTLLVFVFLCAVDPHGTPKNIYNMPI